MKRFAVACAAIACFASTSLALGGDAQIFFRGRAYASNALPNELDAATRAVVLRWREFAKDVDARIDIEDKGRLVLLSPANTQVGERALPLIAHTLEVFEAAVPAPQRLDALPADATPASAKKPDAPAPLPEDPEEPPAGAPKTPSPPPSAKPAAANANHAPSDDEPTLDRRPAVLMLLRNGGEFAKSLAFVVKLEPYLKSWTAEAAKQSGYALERPLCGAMVVNQPDQEEWNPDNEIVNRCMQTMVLRRFGMQPYWVMQGLGWLAEMRVEKGVFCFPYRTGFVSAYEHTDWDKLLATEFKERTSKPLAIDEFAGWKRGTWDGRAAHMAWGVVDHLASTKPRELSGLLEEFRVRREANSRIEHADGTWVRDRDFELALDDQKRALSAHFGAKVFEEIAGAWRKAGEVKK